MNVAILAPRRAGFRLRDRNWRFVKEWWETAGIGALVEGASPDGPFNRSAALNAAADAAGDWDVAVIIDADVICDPGQVRSAVQLAHATGGPVLAYSERMHLTEMGTRRVIGGYRGNWMAPGFVHSTHLDSCSSAYVVTRDLWDAVGGFDEQFVGWGWEDVAFRCATETIAERELVQMGGKLWHLWHEISSENNRAEETFRANRARGGLYRRARMRPAVMRAILGDRPIPPLPLPDLAVEMADGRIPRILHRTVPAETSSQVEGFWRRAREITPGWKHRTWQDPLDPADWPRTSGLWGKCQNGAQRAGLIRLEVLARYGGVYIDSDVELYRPLESLLGFAAFAAWEDAKVVPDAVLGAVAHHPAIEAALELACARVRDGQDAWQSGPGVTTLVLPGRDDVLLLPPGSFYPWHYHDKDGDHRGVRAAQPWAFGAHHWHGSWLPT